MHGLFPWENPSMDEFFGYPHDFGNLQSKACLKIHGFETSVSLFFNFSVNGPKCCPICGHTRVLNHGNSKPFAKQQDLPKPRVVSRHQRNIWMSNDQTVPDTLISVQITTSSGTILFLSLAEHSKENNMIWQTSFQSTVRIKRLQANPVFSLDFWIS